MVKCPRTHAVLGATRDTALGREALLCHLLVMRMQSTDCVFAKPGWDSHVQLSTKGDSRLHTAVVP